MADFPSTIFSPRTKTNRHGIVYDSAKTSVGFAEDFIYLDNEVVAIETYLLSTFFALNKIEVNIPFENIDEWTQDNSAGCSIVKEPSYLKLFSNGTANNKARIYLADSNPLMIANLSKDFNFKTAINLAGSTSRKMIITIGQSDNFGFGFEIDGANLYAVLYYYDSVLEDYTSLKIQITAPTFTNINLFQIVHKAGLSVAFLINGVSRHSFDLSVIAGDQDPSGNTLSLEFSASNQTLNTSVTMFAGAVSIITNP